MLYQDPTKSESKAHVIVFGNEKGGAGKTTSAMHVIASLLALDFKVSSIDVDVRQQSLSHYIENRLKSKTTHNLDIKLSNHFIAKESNAQNIMEKEAEERSMFMEIFNQACESSDFVVIDTPGSNSFLSRLAHSFADTVVTPINDSFVDLDVLVKVEVDGLKIDKPAIYSQMIWEQKMERAKRDRGTINWFIMRNRLSNIDAKNKRHMTEVLEKLSQRLGTKIAPGFSERVIFRELFLHGLTLLDLGNTGNININFSMSHLAAKQELRDFLAFLNLNKINRKLVETEEEKTEASFA